MPIHIKAGRHDNEMWTALQSLKSRHRGAHTEFAGFVIARRQDPTFVARASDCDGLAAQLVSQFGAPDLSTARLAAEEEIGDVLG